MTAIERIGEAKNGCETEHPTFGFEIKCLKVGVPGLGHGAAMEAAKRRNGEAFLVSKAGHVGVSNEISRVFVVACAADEMSDVMQDGGSFEKFSGGGREAVNRLEGMEQAVREKGHVADMLHGDFEAFGHGFDEGTLFVRELGKFLTNAAGSEICNDAVADAGAAIMDGALTEKIEDFEEDGRSSNDDFGAAGTDAGDFATAFERTGGELLEKIADLGGGGAHAICFVAAGAWNLIGSTDDGGGGG